MEKITEYKPDRIENEVPVFRTDLKEIFEKHKVFVFGYGSLLFEHGWTNRNMFLPPKEQDLHECRLKGFERGPWGLFSGANYYGIIRNPNEAINGVIAEVHSFTDWVELMATERIAGIFEYANYRVVDVTSNICDLQIPLPQNAVVHAVCNLPENRQKVRMSVPASGYYNYVWSGIEKFRSKHFQKEFLKTGGVKSVWEIFNILYK